ncbi:Serine protease, subtilisin family [Amycolatopsis marina]|uniref:Serine protease, subtilisin family n=1 Tax=Amycolatopsis marina TaxID=490629 RepID=A0A1I0WJK4_9PSEU|nr:S8 family peptidase [Amycolatopsis marina]SFA88939.1 Serine protease, subtilisin family [Amycolatopsis marina]
MRQHHRSRRRVAGACVLAGVTALAAFAVAGNAAATPEGEIRGAGAEGAVDGSYIVVFEDSDVRAQAVPAEARALASKYKGQLRFTYDTALRGFSATMSERQARRLAAEPNVAYVEQDKFAKVVGTQTNPPWGLDRIDEADLPMDGKFTYPDTAGGGVTAYVLDTGVRTTHNEFESRAANGYDFIDNDPVANDCNGHGTHVAGTIGSKTYGVAKKVDLVGVRVLNCQGSGQYSQIIAGMDWVSDNAQLPAVANMSLGGGASSAVDDAARGIIASGVTLAVAAGNSGVDACQTSPARTGEAITVGASDQQDRRSIWRGESVSSNWGRCLDIWAPGTEIKSTWSTGDSATNTIGGTSMATPHVAGAAALHLAAKQDDSPRQVRDALVNNATSGVLTDIKTGSPNELLNMSYLNDGGGDPGDPTCAGGTNGDDVSIPDSGAAVTSELTFTGCEGKGTTDTSVAVAIKHTYTGDLKIELVGPSGKVYGLKTAGGESTIDLTKTYAVDTSSENRAGTWKLRVQDVYDYDEGTIDSFGVTF